MSLLGVGSTGSRAHGKLGKGTFGRGPVRGRTDQDQDEEEGFISAEYGNEESGFLGL